LRQIALCTPVLGENGAVHMGDVSRGQRRQIKKDQGVRGPKLTTLRGNELVL